MEAHTPVTLEALVGSSPRGVTRFIDQIWILMAEVLIMQTEWGRMRESNHATSHRLMVTYHSLPGLFGDHAKQPLTIRVPLTLAVLGISV